MHKDMWVWKRLVAKKLKNSIFSHRWVQYGLYKFENTLSAFQMPKDAFNTWKLADFGRGENWLHHPLYKLFMKDLCYFACEGLKMACGEKNLKIQFSRTDRSNMPCTSLRTPFQLSKTLRTHLKRENSLSLVGAKIGFTTPFISYLWRI